MKTFFNKILTLLFFILSLGCFYIFQNVAFHTTFINIIFLVVGLFFLFQACGKIDEIYGYGKYNKDNQSKDET